MPTNRRLAGAGPGRDSVAGSLDRSRCSPAMFPPQCESPRQGYHETAFAEDRIEQLACLTPIRYKSTLLLAPARMAATVGESRGSLDRSSIAQATYRGTAGADRAPGRPPAALGRRAGRLQRVGAARPTPSRAGIPLGHPRRVARARRGRRGRNVGLGDRPGRLPRGRGPGGARFGPRVLSPGSRPAGDRSRRSDRGPGFLAGRRDLGPRPVAAMPCRGGRAGPAPGARGTHLSASAIGGRARRGLGIVVASGKRPARALLGRGAVACRALARRGSRRPAPVADRVASQPWRDQRRERGTGSRS